MKFFQSVELKFCGAVLHLGAVAAFSTQKLFHAVLFVLQQYFDLCGSAYSFAFASLAHSQSLLCSERHARPYF